MPPPVHARLTDRARLCAVPSPHRSLRRHGRRDGSCRVSCTASAPAGSASAPPTVTVVANTADDIWVHGLKVCPDLDTVMYTLGEGIDLDRGWGRREETWSAKEELAAYGVEPTWFGLGDRDIATHLVRTQMLEAGYPLSAVTEALCRRWLDPSGGGAAAADERRPGRDPCRDRGPGVALGPPGRALPGVLGAAARPGPRREAGLRRAGRVPPGPGVLDAIADADVVVLPPSNPVVSVGTILGVPGSVTRCATTSAPVVGLSPIVGGTHVRGMAEQMLTSIGVEVSAAGVAGHYGARSAGGILDGWLVDETDAAGRRGRGARHRVPRRTPDDDRPRRDRRHGRSGARSRLVTAGRLEVLAPGGVGEVVAGDDLAALGCGTATSRTGTSWR